jgi:glyoxylase-like metal-dependent hydrolase (beta-lactamase superfamily II)/rhodanese-related sulfurtransferase
MTIGVVVVETSSLGDRTYLVHDGTAAVVVDPQRDIDRLLYEAGRIGVRIAYVAETHLHNDYVSGGLALARLTGAGYLVAAADEVGNERIPVADGDRITVSATLSLQVLATPGHTFHHLSYVVLADGEPVGVCTGGSLLYGTTGRTDLLGGEQTITLARHQHASVRKLADGLPAGVAVWPTHGFGSFCAAGAPDVDESTIGRERHFNPALTLPADAFVELLVASLGAFPAYYAHMGARNAAGADPIDLSPPRPATPAELRQRIDAGEWVVDLRARKAFAYRHLTGTLSFGADGPLATWLGWTLPAGTPLTLLGESPEQVAQAQRELARIGIDRPVAAASGAPEDWADGDFTLLGTVRTATFADLAAAGPVVVIDVRSAEDWAAGHIDGAQHLSLPEVNARLAGVPDGPVWVHCAAGYRAAAAVSLLVRAGRDAILVDDLWQNAAVAGLPIV